VEITHTRFRPTVWPGQVVEVPKVFIPESVDLTDGVIVAPPSGLSRTPAPELYLRGLLDLDVESDTSIAAFIAEHGLCSAVDLWPRTMYLPDAVKTAVQDATFGQPQSIEVPRWTLIYLRLLVRMWIALSQDEPIVDAWTADGLPEAALPGLPAQFWANMLNSFLSSVHVRVRLSDFDDPSVSLHEALAVQLANAVADTTPLRRCANETCGRWFVRQSGRNQYGPRTRGVIYCDQRCARAQAERARRRRKAEQ
jgi:hypothetical protein